MGMLAPRKFMQKRKKVIVFKDAADEDYQKNWRRLMNEIDEAGTAVEVLRRDRIKNQALPRELVLGTLKRFKQMKRWNLVSESNQFKETEEVFETLLDSEKSPLKPNQKMFHMMIYMHKKAGSYENARRVFSMMAEREVEQSTVTYNSLMCTPDLCSYTTMLSAYVNASDMDGAEKFFRRLKQDGLSPNEVTYGALIKGYAQANDLEKMMAKYEEMRSSGIRANQTVLTTIMDAYGKNKDFDSAVIWYKMESSGVAPDKKTKNILISLEKSHEELQDANMLVGNKDWQGGVPQSNAKLMTFAYDKAVDEDDADDYDDDGADDDEEDDDSDFSDNAEEAFSIRVERADTTALGMSYAR